MFIFFTKRYREEEEMFLRTSYVGLLGLKNVRAFCDNALKNLMPWYILMDKEREMVERHQ
jgi:hypothetical protein